MAFTTPEAVALVAEAIKKLDVGPETITAAAVTAVRADWDQRPDRSLVSKMAFIRLAVLKELDAVLPQMPQVLLLAPDHGAVMTLFGPQAGTVAACSASPWLRQIAEQAGYHLPPAPTRRRRRGFLGRAR